MAEEGEKIQKRNWRRQWSGKGRAIARPRQEKGYETFKLTKRDEWRKKAHATDTQHEKERNRKAATGFLEASQTCRSRWALKPR